MSDLINTIFSSAWSIVLIILFFGGSIFVHELGHFLAARWRGLKIERFSIGFGPRIFGWTRDGIEYRVSWIPLGGYVSLPQLADMRGIEGEPTDEAEKLPPISYTSKMIVAVMGAVFNVIFAFVLASVLWAIKQPVAADEATTRIGYVSPTIQLPDGSEVKSPASDAGLQVGDTILAIDGVKVSEWADVTQRVVTGSNRENDGRRLALFRIDRAGKILEVPVYPQLAGNDKFRRVGIAAYFQPVIYGIEAGSVSEQIGLKPGDRVVSVNGVATTHAQSIADHLVVARARPVSLEVVRDAASVTLAIPAGGPITSKSFGAYLGPDSKDVHIDPVTQIVGHMRQAVQTLSSLINPRSDVGVDKVSGPIEIIYVFHLASKSGIRAVLYLTVLVNISLAVFNLLPIPVLDGGHMLFATIAKLRGRAIPPNILVTTQSVFMVLLLSMVLYVSYFNVIRVHRMTSRTQPAEPAAAPAAPEPEPAAP